MKRKSFRFDSELTLVEYSAQDKKVFMKRLVTFLVTFRVCFARMVDLRVVLFRPNESKQSECLDHLDGYLRNIPYISFPTSMSVVLKREIVPCMPLKS